MHRIKHFLQKPVALVIMPIFAFGIDFTMSIFITNFAFIGNMEAITDSKMAILLASLIARSLGFLWLKLFGQPVASDTDADTMNYDMTEVS